MKNIADLIIVNGNIATVDKKSSLVSAVAIKNGIFIATGTDQEILEYQDKNTKVIDVGGRTVIPGLNDSHLHIIRAGLNYNMELRWDGIPSLEEALRRIREQVPLTPDPQWVRVVGGWSEYQFYEQRVPTVDELNNISVKTPIFILHLYHCALLNKAGLQAAGYSKDGPTFPASEIQRDNSGSPTGLLTAKPNALILYSTLDKGPKLVYQDQVNSTRQFMYELNRFGVTSAIDAGGGFQNYPENYAVINDLAKQGLLTVRISYNLFTQRPRQELEDFSNWMKLVKPGDGDDFYRMNGAGEMLVFSAADFENFPEPRPDLIKTMESELKAVVTLLAKNRWPFRLHATYGESITRFLNVFEEVNSEIPFKGLRWFFDHAETIFDSDIDRVRKLGGGIAIQDRMAFQGESFIARYGKKAAENSPPIKKMIERGVPVGAGTDATRVSTYNPWITLYWLVTGKTVGGTSLYPESNRLNRMESLRLYTIGSAWFSSEENKKGSIESGKLADLVVLSSDYFTIPEEEIKHIESLLTIVGGKIVYGAGTFKDLAPPRLPVTPSWSPVAKFGGYTNAGHVLQAKTRQKTRNKIKASPLLCSCCDEHFSF